MFHCSILYINLIAIYIYIKIVDSYISKSLYFLFVIQINIFIVLLLGKLETHSTPSCSQYNIVPTCDSTNIKKNNPYNMNKTLFMHSKHLVNTIENYKTIQLHSLYNSRVKLLILKRM